MNYTMPLPNADVIQSALADNALAFAVAEAEAGQRVFVTGIEADYSAAVNAVRLIQLDVNEGLAGLLSIRWDFSNGPFRMSFPAPTHLNEYSGTVVQADLQASGTPGITGRIALFHFKR